MGKNFILCRENELRNVLKTENVKRRKLPRIYMAGYTKFSSWVYEDWSPDCDYLRENFYFVDYSDDGEDAVWDKFFDYTALKAYREDEYEKIIIDKEEYSIDVIYNEFECYSLTAFWHTAALTEGEIDWLNDQDGGVLLKK